MLLEPGGHADKMGNRYEGRWVVSQLLRLLAEDLTRVQVEVVGDEERGVDLWVERPDGVRLAQQCKIGNGRNDRWSVADLASRGILGAMQMHLEANEQNEFVLITTLPSAVLQGICESARRSDGNPESFYEHQIQKLGDARRKVFGQYCERMGVDETSASDRARAYSFLRRTHIETWPAGISGYERLLGEAGMLVTGDPRATVALLADYAIEQLRKPLDAATVWSYLDSCKMHPRRVAQDLRVVPAIRELQQQFTASIEQDLIGGSLMPREATVEILRAIEDRAVVAVHGHPGQGKSGVLLEAFKKLTQDHVECLPIRLDRQIPRGTTRDFGSSLGLPESPVTCLVEAAAGRRSVLVLDQLDALRWTSHHSLEALEVCKALVREVRAQRDLGAEMSVILACRSYDIQNDPEIKKWLAAEKGRDDTLIEVAVGDLKSEDVQAAVANAGLDVGLLTQRQLEILASPQQLAMWLRIAASGGSLDFQSRVQLMREYWSSRTQEMVAAGADVASVQASLASIVDFMEQNASLTAPVAILRNAVEIDPLLSAGILRQAGVIVSFAHQSYLDFQIASRVVRDLYSTGRTLVEWLGALHEQSLFRREQLRQALCLMSEEGGTTFDTTIAAMLDSDEVRFHLKHLCLEVVGQLESPSDALITALVSRANDAAWTDHVLATVFRGHPALIHPLIQRGIIAKWLSDETTCNAALWLLRSVAESLPDDVVTVLEPLADEDDWQARVLNCLAWNAQDDSDSMFELRLRLARAGVFRDYVAWPELQPGRRLQLLEAALETSTPDSFRERLGAARRRSRFEHWTNDDLRALLDAARADPTEAWRLAIRQIRRLAPVVDEPFGALQQWLDSDKAQLRQGVEGVPHGLTRIALESGSILARTDGEACWDATAELRELESPVIENILVEAYALLPSSLANRAIEWLLQDTRRFGLGTGRHEPMWMPTRRLVEALSPFCDENVFDQLEEAIRSYHLPTEKRDAEYWLTTWKRGYYGDYWGRCQHFLLPALPDERCKTNTLLLVDVLARKYDQYPEERFLSSPSGIGGYVGSTLSDDLTRISDDAWLGIVSNEEVPEEGWTRRKQVGDDRVAESSIPQFARRLEHVAKRFPERFALLALEFPPNVHSRYKTAILDAMKATDSSNVPEEERGEWAPAPVDLLEEVLAKFSDEDSRDFASAFCWLISNRAEDVWSDAALERLMRFATDHPDPKPDALAVTDAGGDFRASKATPEGLLTNALNCVRGVAGRAIGSLLRAHPELLEKMTATLQGLCDDDHPAVRVAGIEACLPVLAIDKDLAMAYFQRACEKDPRVTATRSGAYFFNCGMESHSEILTPLIMQMVDSGLPEVSKEGAKEIAARCVFGSPFESKLRECLDGSTPQRQGVAQVASYLVTKQEYFEACTPLVTQLMNDPDSVVRSELRRLVRSQELFKLPEGRDLIRQFVGSAAFLDDPTGLLYGLDEHTGDLIPFADVIFAAASQFVGPLLEASRGYSQAIVIDVGHMNRLLLRLYEQAVSTSATEIINRCLDAWDSMFKQRVGGANEVAKNIA